MLVGLAVVVGTAAYASSACVLSFRVIARLDIKGANLIKGVQMEGLRVIGKPAAFARKYAEEGADEILYLDTVASLYGRNNLTEIIEEASDGVFVPITCAGGVRTVGDVQRLLDAGADKVAINSAAIREPALIRRCADRYGSQAIVVSIEAKRVNGGWEAYTDCGRERTGKEVKQWAEEAVALGAGEILLTSVDRDGTRRGPDLELAESLDLPVPVVLSGGIAAPEDAKRASKVADALAIGCALHYWNTTIFDVKSALSSVGVPIR